jgi:signal transduction histidine kinase
VETSVGWADLPAAVEVAAYRIVVEALNNAVKHSGANLIEVHLAMGDELCIEVTDNGDPGEWPPGVGLLSMTERAAEIGGRCTAGPTPTGGQVLATLPL